MKNFHFLSRIIIFHLLFICHKAYSQEEHQWKIAIIGAHDPEYNHIGQYAHQSKLNYAKKHGYDVFLYTEYLSIEELGPPDWTPPKTRAGWEGYWYKLVATKRHLEDYDWLFYLDSDALIMNDSIKLESLIDDNYDFIATAEDTCNSAPILSGQFLIKNSEWTKQFLSDWLSIGNTHIQPGFDGGALIKLYSENLNLHKKIKILPIREMGSNFWNYQEEDFVIQFAGFEHCEKERLMKEYFEVYLKHE